MFLLLPYWVCSLVMIMNGFGYWKQLPMFLAKKPVKHASRCLRSSLGPRPLLRLSLAALHSTDAHVWGATTGQDTLMLDLSAQAAWAHLWLQWASTPFPFCGLFRSGTKPPSLVGIPLSHSPNLGWGTVCMLHLQLFNWGKSLIFKILILLKSKMFIISEHQKVVNFIPNYWKLLVFKLWVLGRVHVEFSTSP